MESTSVRVVSEGVTATFQVVFRDKPSANFPTLIMSPSRGALGARESTHIREVLP